MPDSRNQIKDAQAKHLADLFGDEVSVAKPATQQATDHAADRARKLQQAADAKKASLSGDEAAKLAELQRRAKAQAAPPPTQSESQPTQSPPEPQPKTLDAEPAPTREESAQPPDPAHRPLADLEELSQRNDLASAALHNMRRHAAQSAQRRHVRPASAPATGEMSEASAPPAPQPTPARDQAPARSATDQPALAAQRPRRPAPTPEELDRLLRQMAERSRAPRPMGGRPESPEAGPAPAETPPPPPEAMEKEAEKAKEYAERLEQLRAKESAAQADIKPIPQADDVQERAEEKPVEATVPIKVEANALASDVLHQAIADLQAKQRAHDAGGQVDGVNAVQSQLPNHPLYTKERS